MGYARKSLISLNDTPYYHIVSRCVRRAWLWGFDEYAGKDYSHRKAWVTERLRFLCSIFAIDVCAFAVMSNHFHLVLFVDQLRARQMTHREVAECGVQVFGTPPVIERYMNGELDESERESAEKTLEEWRSRLFNISWFMKRLNEHLARRANAEDECTGKFWGSRFKSQALLDEAGLLTAMTYVDLNPIRAGIASTPEESQFTSIYERIRAMKQTIQPTSNPATHVPLKPFASDIGSPTALPFSLTDYLELVDWTGRILRPDKPGHIPHELPSIARRLAIDPEAWQRAMQPRGNVFGRAMGRLNHLRLHARTLGQQWVRGLGCAAKLYV